MHKVNKFMSHLTVDTGNSRKSSRSEVADDVIKVLGNWLLSGNPTMENGAPNGVSVNNIPSCPGFSANIAPRGESLVVGVLYRGSLCLTFSVASCEISGKEIWKELGIKGPQPIAPWCAVKFEPGIISIPFKDHLWLGDFERSVAWAWLEQK